MRSEESVLVAVISVAWTDWQEASSRMFLLMVSMMSSFPEPPALTSSANLVTFLLRRSVAATSIL